MAREAAGVVLISEPFCPQTLTADASLQRVVIAALRGVPPDIAGRPASEICSRDALAKLVLETGFLPAAEPDRLGDQLGELRSSPDPGTRDVAGRVLHGYGVRLGALLATLLHPGTPTEQSGTPGRMAYLEYWRSIRRVWLGGGLLAPGTRADIVEGAKQLLDVTGTAVELCVAPSPTVLPLVGAARLVDAIDGRAVVADAGHTSIKSAVAVIQNGALAALETLPAWPAPRPGDVRAVETELVAALVSAVAALGTGSTRHPRIVLSVASYLNGDAAVDDGRSIYGGVSSERIRHLLTGSMGNDVSIELVHDGSAGAYSIADPGVSAVVTVGTWLGIGFTPAKRALLPGEPVLRKVRRSPDGA